MEDNYIQLQKNDILKLGIKDAEGNDTGNFLEFDLEDIELPLRLQEMSEKIKKIRMDTHNKLKILEKKQDHKGKKLLSYKQEEEIKIMQDFYKRETDAYNMFLGENGVEKLLNGRKLNWSILDEIGELIEKQIAPKLKLNEETIAEKIKRKYGSKRDDVIE
jgi:hypothetical protein